MIDLLGYTGTIFLTVIIISSLAIYADGPVLHRTVGAGAAALWAGFAAGSASAGLIGADDPFPLIGLFLLAPLIAALVAGQSRSVRAMLGAVPLALLVGLHAGRILAFLFLALEQAGRLAGPFPFYAGWGDIVTGLFAIPIAFALTRSGPRGKRFWLVVFLWNLFGILDLLDAIVLGVASSVGSPLEIIHRPPGSEAMQLLPFSLVPTVLVPFYLIIHAAIWVRVLKEMRRAGPAGSVAADARA